MPIVVVLRRTHYKRRVPSERVAHAGDRKSVEGKVQRTLHSASEVVREGFRLLNEHDEIRVKWREQIERGWPLAGPRHPLHADAQQSAVLGGLLAASVRTPAGTRGATRAGIPSAFGSLLPPRRRPTEHIAHAAEQLLRGERLSDEGDAGIEHAVSHDESSVYPGRVEHPDGRIVFDDSSTSSRPLMCGITTSVSKRWIGPACDCNSASAASPSTASSTL